MGSHVYRYTLYTLYTLLITSCNNLLYNCVHSNVYGMKLVWADSKEPIFSKYTGLFSFGKDPALSGIVIIYDFGD